MTTKLIFISLACVLCSLSGMSQMTTLLENMPKVKWNGKQLQAPLTDLQKLERLAFLPAGDSVQFELPNYDPENAGDEPRYFPLDVQGLSFLDLDFDGDLDLLYSGTSGWSNLMDTKVYLLDKNRYTFLKTLNGRLLDIEKTDHQYILYTLWTPCCDSYTSRIEKTIFSAAYPGQFLESISFIGISRLKGMPDFSKRKSVVISNADLYAFPADFKETSPYFKNQTKEKREALQKDESLKLISLTGNTQAQVLDQKTANGEKWWLIITAMIPNSPPSDYEWSTGAHRRFIGWVKHVNSK